MVRVHRWLSLTVLLFWLAQALSGIILVFRWELDDLTLSGERVPVDIGTLGNAIDAISAQRGRVSEAWASSEASERFDVYYSRAHDGDYVLRVDGVGRALRDRSTELSWRSGAFYDTLTLFHTSLLVDDGGRWIVALSGVLLFTNLALGVTLALRRQGDWASTLFSRPRGTLRMRLRGWHLRLGLWGALPIASMIIAGILLCFADELEALAGEIPPPQSSRAQSLIGSARALQIAADRHPGARLSALTMPTDESAWYLVRLLATDELPRNWGRTLIYIDAGSGEILSDQPARAQPAARRLVELLYPFHTGQMFEFAGRSIALLAGIWIVAMAAVGISMWWARPRAPAPTQDAPRERPAPTTMRR